MDYIYAETYTTDEDVIADELKWLTEYDLETGDLMDEYFYTYRSGDVYIYALGVNADKTVTRHCSRSLSTSRLPRFSPRTPTTPTRTRWRYPSREVRSKSAIRSRTR